MFCFVCSREIQEDVIFVFKRDDSVRIVHNLLCFNKLISIEVMYGEFVVYNERNLRMLKSSCEEFEWVEARTVIEDNMNSHG